MSDFLGWAYIVVGGLCIVLGLISATAESFKTRKLHTKIATLKASDMQILQQINALNIKQSMKLAKYGETFCRTILMRATGRVPHDVQEEYRKTFPKDENPMNMPMTSFTTKKLELLLASHTATHAKVDEVLEEMGLSGRVRAI